nr:DoxX family protein [uncultured Hyphomonas sp.]
MIARIKRYAPIAYSLVASAVFLDSLRFKYTNAIETQVIFGRLDAWATSLGAPGLFAQTGLFSQYVIGTAELLAATLLLLGLFPAFRRLQTLGALIAVAVMTGAVNFHLWTPLGIDPNNDGGGLFVMAVMVWLSSIAMLIARRKTLFAILSGIRDVLVPPAETALRSEARHAVA